MNNIHRVLGDVFSCLVDVPGIFICALLKGSLGRYE